MLTASPHLRSFHVIGALGRMVEDRPGPGGTFNGSRDRTPTTSHGSCIAALPASAAAVT